MTLSVHPAKRVEPSADHVNDVHEGILADFLDEPSKASIGSGRRVSTTILDSKSQILIDLSVAAQSQ